MLKATHQIPVRSVPIHGLESREKFAVIALLFIGQIGLNEFPLKQVDFALQYEIQIFWLLTFFVNGVFVRK